MLSRGEVNQLIETQADPEPQLDRIVNEVMQELQSDQGIPADPARVRELVEQEWARYHDARVRTFLPVLVRRAVIEVVR